MSIERKIPMDHLHAASIKEDPQWFSKIAMRVGFFVWNYFEMMLAMGIGATLFELLVPKLPTSTRYALDLNPGTFPYIGGIAMAMMFVMIAWMNVRGHGWRHSVEMAVAMLLPVALAALISGLKGGVAWFDDTYCSAMCVGMLAAMLYRWDHFTRWSFRSAQHGH